MTPYRHEQLGGRLYFVSMLIGVAVTLVVGVRILAAYGVSEIAMWWLAFAAFFVLVAIAFGRLTIEITGTGLPSKLRWFMTFGWPAGEVAIDAIADAQIVAVTFWMGVGIHLTLRGWVWNVALGKGVQIRSRDGRNTVLGTDDAEGLLAAIARARAAAAAPP
jgi:hypothetical protein